LSVILQNVFGKLFHLQIFASIIAMLYIIIIYRYILHWLPYILAYKSQNLRQNLHLKVGGATYTRVIK